MTVEVYLGRYFDHEHERRAFGRFLQEMLDRYQGSRELYLVLAEFLANRAAIDLLVVTRRAFIVIDLKELVHAQGYADEDIKLSGTQNGAWQYSLNGGGRHTMGGREGHNKNPYLQLQLMRYHLCDWLLEHPQLLPGGVHTRKEVLNCIVAWAAISPGFDGATAGIDLPWRDIKAWFKVLPLRELAFNIGVTVCPSLELPIRYMRDLVQALGVTRCDNLREFVPDYVAPAPPRIAFFAPRPPVCRRLVDRQAERAELCRLLDDKHVSIISLGGPGGMGKTELAAWLCDHARQLTFDVLWVNCAGRAVTLDSFLGALASRVESDQLATLLRDGEQRLEDRLEAAADFLDSRPRLLVLDDFHKVDQCSGLRQLFNYVVRMTRRVKIVLTARHRPTCLDNPLWAPGVAAEVLVGGLPLDAVQEYLEPYASTIQLTHEQRRIIWERTAGNPVAINCFLNAVRDRGQIEQLYDLPLYSDEEADRWAQTLLDGLSEPARSLAYRLAVVRTELTDRLIGRLARCAQAEALILTRELVDHYILKEVTAGLYSMHEYIRCSLAGRTPEKMLAQAHWAAGNYFVQMARESQDAHEQIEALMQALYHFEQGQHADALLGQADACYEKLLSFGDHDRARTVASQALHVVSTQAKPEEAAKWRLRLIRQQIDARQFEDASRLLKQGLSELPKPGPEAAAHQGSWWQTVEAQLQIEQGRLADCIGDRTSAVSCFEAGLRLAEQAGNDRILAECLEAVGRVERHWSELGRARQHLTRAEQIARQLSDYRLVSRCISNLGLIAREQGELERAQGLFAAAYDLCQREGYIYGAEINQGLLGDLVLRAGDLATAETIFRKRLAISQQIGNRRGQRIALGWLVETLTRAGRLEEAEGLFQEYEQRCNEAGDEIGLAFVLKRRGLLQHARGNYEAGDQFITEGIERLKASRNERYIPDFERALHLPRQLKLL